MRKKLLFSGAAVLAGMGVSPVAAQAVIEEKGVADRARPDYDPIGARFGSYIVYPSVTVTGEATDNYYATPNDKRSDGYIIVSPEVYVRSDLSRRRIEARAFFTQGVHANLGGENTASGGASLSGAYEPTRDTQLTANVSAAHYIESRASLGAFQGTGDPVKFETYHAGLGVTHNFVDLSLGLNGSLDRYDFHDTRLPDGTPVDQDYRDTRLATVGGTAQYSLRNGIGLIASASYVSEHFDFGPGSPGYSNASDVNRNSSGFNLLGGVTLELSHLIFGHVEAGYVTRNYNDPQLFDYGGLSFSGDVLWNVTPLTSLRFRASRSIQDTSSQFFAGNTVSDFRFSVDHELYRNIILSGDIDYGHFTPNGPGIGGDQYYAGVSARYLITRRYSVTGSLRHAGRSSNSEFLRYQANYASLSFRVAF